MTTTPPEWMKFDASLTAAYRAKYEPLGLCPNGYEDNPEALARSWANTDDLPYQVYRSKAWLARQKVLKYVRRSGSSYGYKHTAENHPASAGYICNGAMIIAAIELGLKVERIAASPNAYFNIQPHRLQPDIRKGNAA